MKFLTVGVLTLGLSLWMSGASQASPVKMELKSPAFTEDGEIPALYTCDGKNQTPPLQWSGAPRGTQSFALTVEDADAAENEPKVHWVLFNLPPTITNLPSGLPNLKILMNSEINGSNDQKTLGYTGPCPSSGSRRYVFRFYALDFAPNLPPGTTKEALLRAIDGHILAEGKLSASYRRKVA